jgi:DNA-binding response OmpR family regulator
LSPKGPPLPDVTLVRWPEEADRLERLRRERMPRLLLVASDALAPTCGECEEDWIRLPADDADVRVRLTSLTQRWARCGLGRDPEIDLAGRIRFQGRWVALSRTEQNLARSLIEHMGSVVDHATLTSSTWPDGEGVPYGRLRVQILHVRRRLEPLGLSIRTVQGRGYVLEPSE